MTESERAELLLGVRSANAPYDHNDFGPSEMKTYAPLVAWVDGPLLTAVQRLADQIEEYEAKVEALRAELEGQTESVRAWRQRIGWDTLPEHPKANQKQPRENPN